MKLASSGTALIAILAVAWLLFFIKGFLYLDPDFGWHLRMGQLILSQGIPKTDPFSYTMSSFPFVDHEWLTNIILFKLYNLVGYLGLSIIFATLTTLALFFSTPRKFAALTIAPLLLATVVIVPFAGIRPQVESWLLFSLFLKIIFDQNLWLKWRFLLPFYFILWTNLHGGFSLGIAVLFLVMIFRGITKKGFNAQDLTIAVICIFATFINPYGIRIWEEIFRSVSDSSLHWTIAEWIPILFRFDIAFILLATLSSLLIFRYRKKLDLAQSGVFFLLLLMGLSSQRHVPFWVFGSLPVVTFTIQYLTEEVRNYQFGILRLKKVAAIFLGLSLIIFIYQNYNTLKNTSQFQEDKYYPKQAVSYLKQHLINGQLFAPYDWGGYLIWKLPEKKVFVDGRMPSWRWVAPNNKESSYAYKDFRAIVFENKNFQDDFNKYNVQTVLWFAQKPKPPTVLDSLLNFVSKWTGEKEQKSFIERLKDSGWKQIYKDEIAVILKK